ncbi:hypothetical protein OH77DRAFT_1113018 [Trametes cingulata]|nr:hypothetical protein OH77DRAFT_1113018 [Trametes cingulata]
MRWVSPPSSVPAAYTSRNPLDPTTERAPSPSTPMYHCCPHAVFSLRRHLRFALFFTVVVYSPFSPHPAPALRRRVCRFRIYTRRRALVLFLARIGYRSATFCDSRSSSRLILPTFTPFPPPTPSGRHRVEASFPLPLSFHRLSDSHRSILAPLWNFHTPAIALFFAPLLGERAAPSRLNLTKCHVTNRTRSHTLCAFEATLAAGVARTPATLTSTADGRVGRTWGGRDRRDDRSGCLACSVCGASSGRRGAGAVAGRKRRKGDRCAGSWRRLCGRASLAVQQKSPEKQALAELKSSYLYVTIGTSS